MGVTLQNQPILCQSFRRWAGHPGELLTHSGWWPGEGAGLVDGSVSRLVQLSSRRATIHTGCRGNAEKGKRFKYGNSAAIRS